MKYLLLSLCVLLFACQPKSTSNAKKDVNPDPHSYADKEKAVVTHLDLNLEVNFDSKVLRGKARWSFKNKAKSDTISFDTRDLNIEKVIVGDSGKVASFALGNADRYLGRALKVPVGPSDTVLTIWYSTSKSAAALQWLTPMQTAGKTYPFLYTQSEAILARSWIPCQDSPGIRFTYNAEIKTPKDLMALMSAENPVKQSADGIYTFRQPRAIPSYLMALAVGDIRFKAIDSRTGVYAEPVTLAKAAWEFADMGRMVTAAEKLYGPYRWGRYDVLVLPPSFPFGGMENPMLTFATPTVIAGDRSLVSLIAHELAHSWSGNLVTNATWNDFWLNEGFTVYLERRIVEAVYGKEEAKMQEVLGYQTLKEIVNDLGSKNRDTKLKGEFEGRDPDEGMTDIPYEKGYFFLRTIEEAVGRQRMDLFLKGYFDSHSFRSATTEDFVKYLEDNLISKTPEVREKIKAGDWIYKPGIPSNIPPVGSSVFNTIDSLVQNKEMLNDLSRVSSSIHTANEKIYFIKALPTSLSAKQMAAIDKVFNFTASGNAEVQCVWYLLSIKHRYIPAYPHIENFLINVGRRKFLQPLYKELAANPWSKEWGRSIYKKARANYHSVSYNTIDTILK